MSSLTLNLAAVRFLSGHWYLNPPLRAGVLEQPRALLILPAGLQLLRSLNGNRPKHKASVCIIRAKHVFFFGFVF